MTSKRHTKTSLLDRSTQRDENAKAFIPNTDILRDLNTPPPSEGGHIGYEDSPLPSVNERLGHLRPSRELLEFYRKKISEFDGEHEEMIRRLENYKCTYEEQHKLQWELRQREEEISELQKALSDMQVYLFQEREHVLRLYSENDRLKIRELDDRKKIQHLLSLADAQQGDVTYFHKEPPSKVVVSQYQSKRHHPIDDGRIRDDDLSLKFQVQSKNLRYDKGSQQSKVSTMKIQTNGKGHKVKSRQFPLPEEVEKQDSDELKLQVDALMSQLEEQTKLSKEQIEALLEDRRVKTEEMETAKQRDTDKIKTLTERLHQAQELLHTNTQDYLELKYECRSAERRWMTEKDRLLNELDHLRERLNVTESRDCLSITNEAFETKSHQQAHVIDSLENQLQQAQKLSDMYREQVITLEDELCRIREEGDIGKELFKERSEKMAKRLTLMNQRYEQLEQRRNLEVEGFKNDIKQLRARLKDVEKQLYKVTLSFGEYREDKDLEILKNVKKTSARSKKMMDDLKQLKGKVYGLENDVRHL